MIRTKKLISRKGFTIVEVSLFVALTGLLIIGVIAGTSNRLNEQKFDDSVYSFQEFLKTIYGELNNVKGDSPGNEGGRSDSLILGKIAVFGRDDATKVYTYSVIGTEPKAKENVAGCNDSSDSINILCQYKIQAGDNSGENKKTEDIYPTTNGTEIQNTDGNTFKGMLLVVKDPEHGGVYTYLYDASDNNTNSLISGEGDLIFNDTRSVNDFKTSDIDFCLKYDNVTFGGKRQNVRVLSGARNTSGVTEIELNSADNRCNS